MPSFAAADGARLAYDDVGDGPPIVLVHAGVTDRHMWDDVVPLLSGSHRVIRYDMRGFGDSVETGLPEWRKDLDLVAVMDAAGVESAAAIGVSMGGAAAFDTALTHPDRIDSIVAVNPGLGGFSADVGEWATERFKRMKPAWDAGDRAEVARLEIEVWLAGPHRSIDDMPPDKVEVMRDWLLTSYEKEAWDREQDVTPPAAERLDEIDVPVLAVLGELDLLSLHATIDHIVQNVPDAEKATIEGTAHLAPWERPDEFASIVRQWMAR